MSALTEKVPAKPRLFLVPYAAPDALLATLLGHSSIRVGGLGGSVGLVGALQESSHRDGSSGGLGERRRLLLLIRLRLRWGGLGGSAAGLDTPLEASCDKLSSEVCQRAAANGLGLDRLVVNESRWMPCE